MLRNRLVLVVLVSAVWVAGCKNEVPGPPAKYAGALKTADGRALAPINVPQRKGDTILGAIAAAEQAPTPSGTDKESEAAEELQIDTSSSKAAAESLVAMVQAGDLSKLPDLVDADQAEQMREMVSAYGPIAKAARDLKLALDEKLPEHDIAGFFPISATLGSMIAPQIKVEEVRPENDNEAVAIIVAGVEGQTPKQIELSLKKVENAWLIVLPDFSPPPDIAEAAAQDKGKAEAYADLARRVRDGDLADAQAVQAQLTEVAAGTYKPAEGADKPAEGGGEEARTESRRPEPAPRPRQRDMTDEVYSGPGMLRNR